MIYAAGNPYWGKDFFGFFATLFSRLIPSAQGGLASDEIQLIALLCLSIAAAPVGTFLVLRRQTMLANSISHTILLGIVLAFLLFRAGGASFHALSLGLFLFAALAAALLTTLLTQWLTHTLKLAEDVSISLVFTTLFALGIVLVTMCTRNTHIGTEVVMGNMDALHPSDLMLLGLTATANLLVCFALFKEFVVTTFDAPFAATQGISSALYGNLLMLLTATTCVAAFRVVGVLLVLTFLVGPVLIARLFTHRLRTLILLSGAVGVLCSLLAVALARHLLSVYALPLSTSGLVVTVLFALYLLCASQKCSMVQCKT